VPTHIAYLCAVVQALVDGTFQRVAISVPPGHAKSETITRRLPIFWSMRYPGDVIVQTGYSQRFAEKHLSYPTREIAREMGVLSPTASAMDDWEFANGSRLVSRGVGAAPTGVNPISLLICDDPINSRAQAASQIERENVWAWWTGSIVQRFWPRTRALVIATRWHPDDLIGRLYESELALPKEERTWMFVNLPAIALEGDPLGRAPGEALWPDAKPLDFLERTKREMGMYDFEALFQGNPTPREGALFKVGAIEYVDSIPPLVAVARAWDLAATQGAGDWTASVKMGRGQDGRFYILDARRSRLEPAARNAFMLETAREDGQGVRILLPQDPGQAGVDQAQSMTRLFAGYSVATQRVTGSKAMRAEPLSAQINGGNVSALRATWNSMLTDELRAFPNGTHDDLVDAASDAFAALASHRPALY